jgi:uncharacterized membrane protein YfcA
MSLSLFAGLALVIACSGFVQGATGVGFALIVAPVLALTRPDLLPGGLLILMLPLNAFVSWRERHALDWRGAGWLSAGRLAGTFPGLWILVAVASSTLDLLIGVATLAAALASMVAPRFDPGRGAFAAAGLVTGITETATGIGGPPLALVYQHYAAASQRANVALCFLLGELVSLLLLAVAGLLTFAQCEIALWFLPALAIGGIGSRLAHGSLDQRRLRQFVIGFAIVSAAVLIVRSL